MQIGPKEAAHTCLHPGAPVWSDVIWGQGRGRLESAVSRGRPPLNHFILSGLAVIELFILTLGRVGRQIACQCYQLLLRTGFYFSQMGRLHFFISCSMFLIKKKCLIRLCRSSCFLTPKCLESTNFITIFDCHCCRRIQSIIHP